MVILVSDFDPPKYYLSLNIGILGIIDSMYFVILGNLWIWRVFGENFLIFLFVVIASLLLILSITHKRLFPPSLLSMFILLLLQIRVSQPVNLTELSNDQIRVRDTRLNEYPPMNLPIAYWMEAKPVTVALSRIRYNFLEQLDPNLYFFANHPRERVGVAEFEHFPYILFPLFLVGIITAFKKYKFSLWLSLAIISTAAFFRENPEVGNISLFPLISFFIYLGIRDALKFIKPLKYKNAIIIVGLIIYFLVFIQTLMYEI